MLLLETDVSSLLHDFFGLMCIFQCLMWGDCCGLSPLRLMTLCI